MTEASFTIVVVGLLALDGVLIPLVRWAMNRSRTFTYLGMVTLLPALGSIVVAFGFVPPSAYGIGLVSLSAFTILYNRWYLFSDEDQLCEGLVWPWVRDLMLANIERISRN